MKRTPMTLRGAERLRQELKQLKSEARPNVIKAIAEARAHGDLSENAEYHAAREQQSFIEGRINDIENRLSNAEVIDVTRLTANGRVVFGSTVELEDQDGGSKVVYQLVGDDEADIKHGMLSVSSPIARALIGKSEGDVVDVTVPGRHAQLRGHVGALRLIRNAYRVLYWCSGPGACGRSPCGWRRRCSSRSPTGTSRACWRRACSPSRPTSGSPWRCSAFALPGRSSCGPCTSRSRCSQSTSGSSSGSWSRRRLKGAALGLSFGAWHGVSAIGYLIACLLVLWVIWKARLKPRITPGAALWGVLRRAGRARRRGRRAAPSRRRCGARAP